MLTAPARHRARPLPATLLAPLHVRVDDEAVTIVRETSDEALRAPVRTDVVPGDDVLAPPASGTAAWADDPGGTWVRTLADLEAGTGQEAAGRITDGAPADPSGLLPLG